MILVHHLRIGRSIFTVWLLEELGLDYELKIYDRNEMGRAPVELKAAHPLGKSPVIEIDGMTLPESGAIGAYLAKYYDPEGLLGPLSNGKEDYARWLQWLHYSEASAFAPLLLKLLLSREAEPKPALISFFADGEVKLHLDYLQDALGDKPHILGDRFSLPDIGTTYITSMADRLELLGDHPKLKDYMTRHMTRPAFTRALEKTGG